MPSNISTIHDRPVWSYYASGAEQNAGGGNVELRITFPEGNKTILEYMLIGPDNYAAGRNIQAGIRDAATGNIVAPLYYDTSADNVRIVIPQVSAAGQDKVVNAVAGGLVIAGKDAVRVIATALAQNETLTISLRCTMRRTTEPTILWYSSGTTQPTVTTSYNEFR